MTYNEKIKFEQDVEQLLKPMLKELYLKWSSYNSIIIHQEFLNYIFKRTHAKILKYANSKKHRKLRYKALKLELENVRVAKEISEFEKNL